MSSEAAVQAAIRHEYARRGYMLYRNNVGAAVDRSGRPVRYGLANDSPELNRLYKSSDLIGWRPRLVTPDMVGEVIAQFVSIEVKASDWRPARTGERYEHEQAQRAWLALVERDGGQAALLRGIDDAVSSG